MKVKNKEICLIITGCISPVKQNYLVLTNVNERLKQYIKSIRYYIEETDFQKIIFCDNSNYNYDHKDDIYNIARSKGKKFEWLSFSGNTQKIVSFGKGYGEGEIIKYVLKNSTLIKSSSYFAKVTGRLIITNINSILKNINLKSYDILMNADIYRKHGIDTRFYIINKYVYLHKYVNIFTKVNDNAIPPLALEDIFFLETKLNKKWSNIFPFPRFVGISGGNGRNYTNESKNKLKFLDFLCKRNFLKKSSFIYYYIFGILKK